MDGRDRGRKEEKRVHGFRGRGHRVREERQEGEERLERRGRGEGKR